jgi:hypothetical protein
MHVYAERFDNLYFGLRRAYGCYELTGSATSGQKHVGKAITTISPVTLDLWTAHLNGIRGLGIVPINEKDEAKFGAIDIDVYVGMDIPAIVKRLADLHSPLVPVRSKSGGLHLYLFLKKSIPSIAVRTKLKDFAASIGFSGSEIFPKQDRVLHLKGDIGSWINMPYFDCDSTSRYAYGPDCKQLSTEQFLDYAESMQQDPISLAGSTLDELPDLSDGPPCLQHLIQQGFGEGSRNDGLYNLGVYLKKAFPDSWKKTLEDFNSRYFKPQLELKEVSIVQKSLSRKKYEYSCTRPPICSHCNMDICRSRRFGVGENIRTVLMTSLTKYDSRPPVWFADVDGGGRLEMTTDDMQNQLRFQKVCMEELNRMPLAIGRIEWGNMINGLMANAQVIEASSDSSIRGQFMEHIEKFCCGRSQARVKEEILLGKPWTDAGITYFRLSDLLNYLGRVNFKEYKIHQISSVVRDIGGKPVFLKLKGKGTNTWSLPEFHGQTESFDVPKMGEESII